MPSYILMQPDRKFAIFSAVTDDFTQFGMTNGEALEWGGKKWGDKIAAKHFASAVADEPVGTGSSASIDGLGRWRSSLTSISLAYGLNYLRTVLSEIGFADAEIPQSAIDAVPENRLMEKIAEIVKLRNPNKEPSKKYDQSELSFYLQKIANGGIKDEDPGD